MSHERLDTDSRSFTTPVSGRRIGEGREVPLAPSVAATFLKLSSNRRHLRLPRPEQDLIHGYAQRADAVEGLTFQDRRAFVVIDADQLIPNGTYRVARIFNMGTDSMRIATEITQDGLKRELFQAIMLTDNGAEGDV